MDDVSFGLVIIVIGNEELDSVVWEELLKLRIELRCQRLVMAHHQRGPVDVLDDMAHRERLARSGGPQKGLVFIPTDDTLRKLFDCFRLVPHRAEVRFKLKALITGTWRHREGLDRTGIRAAVHVVGFSR